MFIREDLRNFIIHEFGLAVVIETINIEKNVECENYEIYNPDLNPDLEYLDIKKEKIYKKL